MSGNEESGRRKMLHSDKKDFSALMTNCWQNFRAAVTSSLIDDWFEELKEFEYFHVRNAFRRYVRETEKYPPTLAAIIRLAKKSAGEEYVNLRDKRPRRCYIDNCSEQDVWTCMYDPKILICRLHEDELILKTHPNSIHAQIIRWARVVEEECRKRGVSAQEATKLDYPTWYSIIDKGGKS
jgi:hypothetical protein